MKNNKLFIGLAVMLIILLSGCSNKNSEEIKPENDQTSETLNEANEKISVIVSEYGIDINEDNVVFTDSQGSEVTISKNPQRVIVLQNSILEIWDEAGGIVVGKVEESQDKIVENAASAEVVGGVGAPSLEKILSLEPDLVIAASSYTGQREIIPVLQQSGIEVIALDIDLLEDYYRTVRLFTAVTGREDLYESHINKVQKGVDNILAKAPKDKNYKTVILYATAKSVTVRDSNSMVGEMLKDLNTLNISDAADSLTDTKTFSMERILKEDPDFIFVQTMGSDMEKIEEKLKSDVLDNPAWASLTAVKEDRYNILPKDLYLYKPNNRYPEAYEGLAKILYPEVFGEN